MPNPTTPEQPAEQAAPSQPQSQQPAPTTAPASERAEGVTADVWSAGDGALRVPLAGLLADDPSLRDAELPADQWQEKLDEYLKSERV